MGADWRYWCKDCKIEIFLGRPARDELGHIDHHPVVLGLNKEHCGHRTVILGESYYYLEENDAGDLVYEPSGYASNWVNPQPTRVWVEGRRDYRRGTWYWASHDDDDMEGCVVWDDESTSVSD